ncbi:PaaI family thioesterase [Salinigranum rubrum]|uniref:PaaI family thioesterase n=1 Tax=Salinigranum rubrum TaxID=755307 RepID=A0A2I8VMZ1_9EURY|nr:PaaI family thioesterase [Salinigranum rubrum]AUV83302.1 PaaI family thioesterase [Salinigranum rubrum]
MTTDAFPPTVTDLFVEYIEDRHGYLSWLGTRIDEVEYGRVVMSVPFDEKLTNDVPTEDGGHSETPQVHGGVAATLIDTAGAVTQRTLFDDPLSGGLATVNLNVNYLRPASGDLTATAEVVRAGGTIGVSTVTVEGPTPDGDGRHPVATGQVAYRLFRDEGESDDGDEAADD